MSETTKPTNVTPRIVSMTAPIDTLTQQPWRAGFHDPDADPGQRWAVRDVDVWCVAELDGEQTIEPIQLGADSQPIFLRQWPHFAGVEAPGAGGFKAKVRADQVDALDANAAAIAERDGAEIHRLFNTPLSVTCGVCHETHTVTCDHFRAENDREIILIEGRLQWREKCNLFDPDLNKLRRSTGQFQCPTCRRFYNEHQDCVQPAATEAAAV